MCVCMCKFVCVWVINKESLDGSKDRANYIQKENPDRT